MNRIRILLGIVFIWTCSSPTKSEPAPQPPTVNNLSITTSEDTPTTFTMTGSDPEGAALTFSVSTQPQNGTVTASGAAGTYTPNANFNGTDTFAYIASDGALSSTAGLVSVTVNAVDDDPNTMNVSAITDEDNAVVITLEAEEYDGDTISFSIKDNPTNGSVTISGDKATYTPNANYYGSDSFTFEAVDYTAKKILNTATASITINPINDAPVVEDTSVEGWDNQNLSIQLNGVDIDGDNLSYSIVDNAASVNAYISGSNIEIENTNHYWGTDSITFQAYDGSAYSDTATLSIAYKRNVNYNIPSHDWKNYQAPWFDLLNIYISFGYDENNANNTGNAYGDFNGDNYIDISYTQAVGDGNSTEQIFFINNGDNTFYVDNDFSINSFPFMQARKTIVGDFNDDGKPDIVRPHGAHGFHAQPTITLSSENGYEVVLLDSGPVYHYHTVSSGDIDNDGDLDLFFAENQQFDGFMINDGMANFSWYGINDIIEGAQHPGGLYTSDMTDIDNDGNIDLIVGGIFRLNDENGRLLGPTIFWGDGSGKFSFDDSTILYKRRDISYANFGGPTHDFAVNDIDGDGLKDIALQSGLDETNSSTLYQVFFATGNRTFEDRTEQVMNTYKVNSPGHVWIILRDIDNDGNMDLVEGEPNLDLNGSVNRKSSWWRWTGSSFVKVQ
tara:strand:- start:51 stop:2066 length:2016 start_codon:yes stop_codon:yes gene_type:complete